MHETPEGFLLCVGVPIARTGVMQYGEGETPLETGEDGVIDVSREEAEVFRPQTIASFEGKAVTIAHPNEFVDTKNWSSLAKGVVQNVRRGSGDQGTDLIADLLITDSVAIQLVKNGLREVSCGYEAEYTQTDPGKGVQTNIIGNHVALVQEGRAGSQYSIKDHKGVTMDKKTLLENLSKFFGKTKDKKALATVTKLVNDAKDENDKPVVAKNDDDKEKVAPGKDAYDALMQKCKDLMDSISSMSAPTEAGDEEGEEEEAPAADEEVATGLEARLDKLEAAVAKLLEGKAAAGDEEGEQPVISDEEMEEEESEDAAGDEDDDKDAKTGDTASRVEILAPGLEAKGKDIKAKALKVCYDTKEGKKVIEQVNGGKAPAFDSKDKVDMLFMAVSELLKVQRNRDMAKSRQARDAQLIEGSTVDMSAEKMNELNEKHYNKNKRS